MEGGIQLTTTQIVSSAVFIAGIIIGLLKYIQTQNVKHYDAMHAAWKARFDETVAGFNTRIDDILEAHKRTTSQLEERIRWYETRDEQWRQQQYNYISTLEKAVDVQQQQTALLDQLTQQSGARKPRSSS